MFRVSRIGIDCSGVLNKDDTPVYTALVKLADHYGKEFFPKDDWISLVGNCVQSMRLIGVDDSDSNIYLKFQHFYKQGLDEGVTGQIYPDVVETLEKLKERGKKLYILSSHPQELLDREIAEIRGYFDEVIGSCLNKANGLKHLSNETPGEFAYIGDMAFDLNAARQAGVFAIGCATGYHTRKELEAVPHDLVIDKFSEILDHV